MLCRDDDERVCIAFSEMKLFIIGNGFDIAHGLKTKYTDFRDFLKDDKTGADILDYYPPDDWFWSDFESNICAIDVNKISEINHVFQMDIIYWSLFSKIVDHLEFFVRKAMDFKPNQCFQGISKSDIAINFNYTDTLVNLYGLSPDNVCFIHGNSIMNIFGPPVSKSLIIGHDKKDFTCDEKRFLNDDDYKKFVNASVKHTDQIISDNAGFFNRVHDNRRSILEVVIFGFSFSKVDSVYFQKVVSIF